MLYFQLLLLVTSAGGVFTKLAAAEEFFSPNFCLLYAAMMLTLIVYAIGWQQLIKRLPLSFAYASKAVGMIYAPIWGALVFDETISLGQLVGIALVIVGVILFSKAEET